MRPFHYLALAWATLSSDYFVCLVETETLQTKHLCLAEYLTCMTWFLEWISSFQR